MRMIVIVCICQNVNSTTIANAVADGASSLDAVREATGAGACCGKCQFKVNGLIQDQLSELSADLAYDLAHNAMA